MKINRYFALIGLLIISPQCYCLNVREALQTHPGIRIMRIDENETLNLHDLHIDSLVGLADVCGIDRVQILNLSNNQLTHLDADAFNMMPALMELNLENNALDTIGLNLFAMPRAFVYVNVAHNRLSREQIQRLEGQVAQDLGMQLINRLLRPLVDNDMRRRSELAIFLYCGLKIAFCKLNLSKANIALDTLVHGANIVDFLFHIRQAHVRGFFNCFANSVHIYNAYKYPSSFADVINDHTGVNIKPFATHPLAWTLSWLPWLHLLPSVSENFQEAMVIPWHICPSKFSKFFNGCGGMMHIFSLGRRNAAVNDAYNGQLGEFMRRVARLGRVDAGDQAPIPAQQPAPLYAVAWRLWR